MKLSCLHCSTTYERDTGVEGFCCAGCREVYALIQNEGFSDYYKMQDRIAEPIKERGLSDVDAETFNRVQAAAETGEKQVHVAFSVVGLSCMGCVWLIQRLCAKQVGIVQAEASLNERKLELEWLPGSFDLKSLASELQRFGYQLEPKPLSGSSGFSSLVVRVGLCAVFTLNVAFLSAYQVYVEPASELVQLLGFVCLSFVFILGALPFYMTVFRAFRIRRIHADFAPASLITASLLFCIFSLLGGWMILSTAALLVSVLITLLLLVRYLIRCLSFKHS